MTSTIDYLQWSTLLGVDLQKPSESTENAAVDAVPLTQSLIAGEYSRVLKTPVAVQIFGTSLAEADAVVANLDASLDLAEFLTNQIQSYLASTPTDATSTTSAALDVLSVGIAALYAFVQAGWTGPEVGFEPVDLLPSLLKAKAAALDTQALDQLSVGGETVYHLSPQILFLHMARIILVDNIEQLKKDPTVAKSAPWWALRTLFLQQRTLEGPAGLLQDQMLALANEIESILATEVRIFYCFYKPRSKD